MGHILVCCPVQCGKVHIVSLSHSIVPPLLEYVQTLFEVDFPHTERYFSFFRAILVASVRAGHVTHKQTETPPSLEVLLHVVP